ncbi:MAG: hypothetical protein ACRDQ0_16495, partial [Pseudonocardia sp.]
MALLAVAAMALPLIWPGSSADPALRADTTWVRPFAPAAQADCAAAGVVCITSNRSSRLEITESNVVVDGQGHTVPGISVVGDNVTIQNFRVVDAEQTGIRVEGDGITVRNNDITQVSYGTDDLDALRFFGNDITIQYNAMFDIVKGEKLDAHVDCTQTWASESTRSSSNVLIEGNHCEDPEFAQCLMAEGPDSTDGGGGATGDSRNWTVRGNFYD